MDTQRRQLIDFLKGLQGAFVADTSRFTGHQSAPHTGAAP